MRTEKNGGKENPAGWKVWLTAFGALISLALASSLASNSSQADSPAQINRDSLVAPAATAFAKLYGSGCQSVPGFESACETARNGTANIQFTLKDDPPNIANRCTVVTNTDRTAVFPSHCPTNILDQKLTAMTITGFLVPGKDLHPVELLKSPSSVKVRHLDKELAEFDLPPELVGQLTPIKPSADKVRKEQLYIALTYFKTINHFVEVPTAAVDPDNSLSYVLHDRNLDSGINPKDFRDLNGYMFEIKSGPPIQRGGSGGWIFDDKGHGIATIEAIIDPQKLDLPPSPFIWFTIATRSNSIWPTK